MLKPHQLDAVLSAMTATEVEVNGKKPSERSKRNYIVERVEEIRESLNPHPAGQKQENVPKLYGHEVEGIQHKYRETVLFFPSEVCVLLFNR
jgi:L-lysine 2,3-aminomutase